MKLVKDAVNELHTFMDEREGSLLSRVPGDRDDVAERENEMTILELRSDDYVRHFWRDCPEEFLALIVSLVVPAARRNLAPRATHTILLDLQGSALYLGATLSDRHRLHSLTGRVVRIARDFDVETTPGGSPKRVRTTVGRHGSITIQKPQSAFHFRQTTQPRFT